MSRPYRAVTAGIVTLVTLIAFEALAVATAMPVVAADLDAVREYGLAFSIFLTALVLGTVLSGGWCDARGPAWPVRTGLVLFGSGLVVSGVADSLLVLLVGRALAGLGGGLLVVAMYVVIAAMFPSPMQPRVFAYMSAAWVLPSILGPLVAGWLATSWSWRAVFLLVPPLTIPPALALLPRLPGIRPGATDGPRTGPSPRRRALLGVGLAVGIGAAQLGLERLSRNGSAEGELATAAVEAGGPGAGAAVAAIVVGVVLTLLTLPSLLPRGTLRLGRGLPTVIALRGLYAGTFFGAETFIPLMLVAERGLSPTEAGAVLTAGAVGWSAGSFLQARPWIPFPRHVLLASGAIVMSGGITLLVLVTRAGVSPWFVAPVWLLTAFGMGLGTSSTSVQTLRLSRPGEEGRNSSSLQVSDGLGSAVGIGLTGAAFAAWHRPGGDDIGLFAGMWLACAAVALLTGLAALRARPPGAPTEESGIVSTDASQQK